MLEYIIDAPWIRTDERNTHDDWRLADALHILMTSAFEEAEILKECARRGISPPKRSLLIETHKLIERLRTHVVLESSRLIPPRRQT